MTALTIDRLTVNLSGLSQIDGQRLAKQIAEELARGMPMTEASRDVPNLHITIPARSNAEPADVDWLAHQVVAEVLRQLNQTLG